MKTVKLISIVMLLTVSAFAYAGEKPELYFITPQDGDVVSSEFDSSCLDSRLSCCPSRYCENPR